MMPPKVFSESAPCVGGSVEAVRRCSLREAKLQAIMQHPTQPDDSEVDLRELARRAAELHGSRALADMPRLAASLGEAPGARQARWRLRAFCRPLAGGGQQPMAELEVRAELPLQCQRCLQTVALPIVDRALFRLVDVEPALTEEELEAEDEALCVAEPIDLLALVEDQLILALPLVPMHPACAAPAPPLGTDAAAAESPFAVLGRLKQR